MSRIRSWLRRFSEDARFRLSLGAAGAILPPLLGAIPWG